MKNTYFTDVQENVILSTERKKRLGQGHHKIIDREDNTMSEKVFLIMSVIFVCAAVLGACFFNLNFIVGLVLCLIPGIMGFMLKKS